MYSLEEKIMNTEIPQNKYNNLTKQQRWSFYNLKNDKKIVMKRVVTGSRVVV